MTPEERAEAAAAAMDESSWQRPQSIDEFLNRTSDENIVITLSLFTEVITRLMALEKGVQK
jgi:hypothetical protein